MERIGLLSELTTLGVGGVTRIVEISSEKELVDFFEQNGEERYYVIGGGSNVLASDDGFNGVVLLMRIPGIEAKVKKLPYVDLCVGAGVPWHELILYAVERSLWGLENLTDIPGTVGASPVQNIGAYGTEVKDVIVYVRAYDTQTHAFVRFTNTACKFAYRDSVFKHSARYVVTKVTFRLSKEYAPNLKYADMIERSKVLPEITPESISKMVHDIRKEKFPDLRREGTAGSFFKNPIVSFKAYTQLLDRYKDLPGYTVSPNHIKIPLAHILDKILTLRGYAQDLVRCYEKQPLVLVTSPGATARDVDTLARDIEKKVFDATQIVIEREVQQIK